MGDIAGMGADLFGSFAESTCAALVISSVSSLGTDHLYSAMSFPLMISATGILVCLVTTVIATDLRPARIPEEIENTLKLQLVISTILATPVGARPQTSWPTYLPGLVVKMRMVVSPTLGSPLRGRLFFVMSAFADPFSIAWPLDSF